MTAKHLLSQIVRGLDGVTAGPWEGRYVPGGMPTNCVDYGVVSMSAGIETCRVWKLEDAAHYARCSPDAMREIAAYVSETEARATAAEATVTALEEALAKAAEALEKFTGHYEPWMDRWADGDESSTFSRHTFGQLRSARAIISQIRSEK